MGSRSSSFTVGVYARAQLVGHCKATLPHTNVCKLLCMYVPHLCGSFRWTSIAVHVNYNTPVHRDPAHSPDMSLLTMLSSTEKGGLWIQSDAGSDYQEIPGGMCASRYFQLQDQYLIFPAQSAWHATQGWERYDRVTLVAYSVRNWPHLAEPMQDTLRSIGFCLPERPSISLQPPRLLPIVVMGQRDYSPYGVTCRCFCNYLSPARREICLSHCISAASDNVPFCVCHCAASV